MTEKSNSKYVPIEQVEPNPWNPNVQDDRTFDALVENIQEVGMDEPVLVRQLENGKYQVINGEHRYEACKVLGFDEIPVIVSDKFDEDMAKFQTVRRHVIQGKMDPMKFTKLFDDMADKYGEEMTKEMMKFTDEKAFNDLYVSVKEELPDDMKEDLDKARGEVKTVDDLSRILNELFSKYGDTLDYNFMVFSYGGRSHLWVLMDNDTKKIVFDEIVEKLKDEGLDANAYFKRLIEKHDKSVIEELTAELDEDIDFEEE